jgi:hypothetical protein
MQQWCVWQPQWHYPERFSDWGQIFGVIAAPRPFDNRGREAALQQAGAQKPRTGKAFDELRSL